MTKKDLRRMLIGFLMIIAGGLLGALTQFWLAYVLLFLGTFLFASLSDQDVFVDYRIADSNEILVRRRYYLVWLPFAFIANILTFGKVHLKLLWKEEYYITRTDIEIKDESQLKKISRSEYIALRNEQRIIYSTNTFSREFMASNYSVKSIGLKRKKIRLILAIVFACMLLTVLTEPEFGAIVLTIIYEAICIPMIILWIPDYKDAKILQQAYDRAMMKNN